MPSCGWWKKSELGQTEERGMREGGNTVNSRFWLEQRLELSWPWPPICNLPRAGWSPRFIVIEWKSPEGRSSPRYAGKPNNPMGRPTTLVHTNVAQALAKIRILFRSIDWHCACTWSFTPHFLKVQCNFSAAEAGRSSFSAWVILRPVNILSRQVDGCRWRV
jgi:hypothetical protein